MVDQGFWPHNPPHPPPSHGVGFGQARDGHRALSHARKRRYGDVATFENNLSVNLICHHPKVVFARQRCNSFQLSQGHRHAGRITRRGEKDRSRS